jgi:hypothetical protein
MKRLGYRPVPEMGVADIEAAIERNQPDELLTAVLSASLYSDDLKWAEGVCLRLSEHPHVNVRGNAIQGFGHLARIHGSLDLSRVLPVIQAGLQDSHEYVRAQAYSAADDVEHFLGWSVSPPEPRE